MSGRGCCARGNNPFCARTPTGLQSCSRCSCAFVFRTMPPLSWRETWYELMRCWSERSPIIDYVDDWPWKMRTDRFTRLRAAAVLHSARLLLSTFITHRRRLLIRTSWPADWLAGGLRYFAYLRYRSCVFLLVFLSRSFTKLITRLFIREHNCDSSID